MIQKIFFEVDVPGYATIVVLILFLGGLQLLLLGVQRGGKHGGRARKGGSLCEDRDFRFYGMSRF